MPWRVAHVSLGPPLGLAFSGCERSNGARRPNRESIHALPVCEPDPATVLSYGAGAAKGAAPCDRALLAHAVAPAALLDRPRLWPPALASISRHRRNLKPHGPGHLGLKQHDSDSVSVSWIRDKTSSTAAAARVGTGDQRGGRRRSRAHR